MGDNVYLGDRNSVRTPMQWSPDRNGGFSRANPQRLFLPPVTDPGVPLRGLQRGNPAGHPELAALVDQAHHPPCASSSSPSAAGRSSRPPAEPPVLAFLRRYQEQVLLVVVNLSRFSQYVELDLSEFEGRVVRELFGTSSSPARARSPTC
jgi:maltose alpha-D-glucosyltransferase/alpha-amylase